MSSAERAPVPGVVRVMTKAPIELPASATAEQSSLAEQLEERPWLVAVAIVAVLAGLLLVIRRRR